MCDPLCGSTPIITFITGPPSSVENPRSAPLIRRTGTSLLRARPRRDPDRPTPRSTARHRRQAFRERPCRSPSTLREPSRRLPQLNQASPAAAARAPTVVGRCRRAPRSTGRPRLRCAPRWSTRRCPLRCAPADQLTAPGRPHRRAGREPRQAPRDRMGRRHRAPHPHADERFVARLPPGRAVAAPAPRGAGADRGARLGGGVLQRAGRRDVPRRTPAGTRAWAALGPDLCRVDADLGRCVEPVLAYDDPQAAVRRGAARPAGVLRGRQRVPQRGAVGRASSARSPPSATSPSATPSARRRRRQDAAGQPRTAPSGSPCPACAAGSPCTAATVSAAPLYAGRRRAPGSARTARSTGARTARSASTRAAPATTTTRRRTGTRRRSSSSSPSRRTG